MTDKDIRGQIKEIVKPYDIGFHLDHKFTAVGGLEREKLVNELAELFTQSVDVEKVKEEFERKFVHKGEDGDDEPQDWTWNIAGSFPIEVFAFFEPYLQPHNAVDKTVEIRKDIDKLVPVVGNMEHNEALLRLLNMDINYDKPVENCTVTKEEYLDGFVDYLLIELGTEPNGENDITKRIEEFLEQYKSGKDGE